MRLRALALLGALLGTLVPTRPLPAQAVAVRFPEGSLHGYLALRSLDGKLLAAGDLTQRISGNRITSHLVFRFKDGSVDDETAVFTQRGQFRLISDRHLQRGPYFPVATDMQMDARSGQVTVRYRENGRDKVETEHMHVESDLANGLLLNALKNISPETPATRVAFIVATPKPRLLHFLITPEGEETFYSAGLANRAHRLRIHVEIGGLPGVFAGVLGKQPPDAHVWISAGESPAFVRSEQPLYLGGPLERVELISPVWR